MSTAEELTNQGIELKNAGKKEEAIEKYNQAIALNPKYGRAYSCRGFIYATTDRYQQAYESYTLAIENGFKDSIVHYNRGNMLNRLGRFEEAVKEYDISIGFEPRKWTAIENKGDVLMTLNRIPEAILCYREALEINPDNLKIYPYLGLLLEELGQLDEAMEAYDRCLAKDPKHFQSNLFKGNQFVTRGSYEEALKHYGPWINNNPPSESLIYHAAQAYLGLGNRDEAMKLYSKVDQMRPTAAVQHFDRGRIYSALGQQAKAIEDYKKAQEILRTNHNTSRSPTAVRLINDTVNSIVKVEDAAIQAENLLKKLDQNSEIAKKFLATMKILQDKKKEIQSKIMINMDRQQDAKAREHMAELEEVREEFNKSYQAIQKETGNMKDETTDLQKQNVDNKSVNTVTAEELTNQGIQLKNAGKMEEAIEKYNQAIALNPKYGKAYFSRGFIYATTDRYQQAYDSYTLAIQNGFKDSATHYNRGNMLNRLGRFEEAVKEYDVAIGLDPKKWTAIENKGDVLMTLNHIPEAILCYREALEINPGNLKVYPYLGLLLEELGRLDKAMEAYDRCLAKDPKHFQSNLFKGNQFAARGSYEEALKHYNIWINNNPPSESLTYHAAQAYLVLGNREEAMKLYNKVNQMRPTAAVQHFDRGRIYAALGQQAKAIEDYKKAQEILRTNHNTSRSPTAVRLINDTVNSIVKVEDAAIQAENALKKLDQKSETTMKLAESVKLLQEKKKEIENNIMNNVDRQQDAKAREQMAELDKVREQFNKNHLEIQKTGNSKDEIIGLQKEADVEGNLDNMRQELDNKSDDFSKKLNIELNKKKLTAEQKEKLNGYFKAFVGTISAVYVTAQIVDNGQVNLDTGRSAATFVSFVVSIAPVVGDVLSSSVTSVVEFLRNPEIIKNARRAKGLAPDSARFSQMVGKMAYELVLNEKKQKEILTITGDELDHETGNMLEKLIKFCENLQDKVDAFLYTQLYSEPSERLANSDANYAIEKWLKGGMTPFDLDKKLVNEILNQDEAPAVNGKQNLKKYSKKSRDSCNTF